MRLTPGRASSRPTLFTLLVSLPAASFLFEIAPGFLVCAEDVSQAAAEILGPAPRPPGEDKAIAVLPDNHTVAGLDAERPHDSRRQCKLVRPAQGYFAQRL
jgi:hypothetical protein